MWALLVITLGSSFFPDCLANTTKKLQRAVSIEHLDSNGLVRRKKEPSQTLGLKKNFRLEMEGLGPFSGTASLSPLMKKITP